MIPLKEALGRLSWTAHPAPMLQSRALRPLDARPRATWQVTARLTSKVASNGPCIRRCRLVPDLFGFLHEGIDDALLARLFEVDQKLVALDDPNRAITKFLVENTFTLVPA